MILFINKLVFVVETMLKNYCISMFKFCLDNIVNTVNIYKRVLKT